MTRGKTSILTKDSVLVRALDLNVALRKPDVVEIRVDGNNLTMPNAALAVLDVFAYPRRLEQGLAMLTTSATRQMDWIEMTALVRLLVEHQVLSDEPKSRPTLDNRSSFGGSKIHALMLNDHTRTDAYLKAIREVVVPGDVVLDLGTGTGILAAAAALAGAAKVYAIEATTIGEAAKRLFRANGIADRVTLIPGWSTKVELPERVDVMVSEIIGNDPLCENVRELTWDAIRRFLKPGARIIPSELQVVAQAVDIPQEFIDRNIFTESNTRKWSNRYGILFGSLVEDQAGTINHVYIRPHEAKDWPRVGQPVNLLNIPLNDINWSGIDKGYEVVTDRPARVNGVVEFFRASLSPETTLTDAPWLTPDHCSWQIRVWILPEPIHLSARESFRVKYRHSIPGERDIITASRR